MCGITGFVDLMRQTHQSELQTMIRGMADTLQHRGPDHGDVWVDAQTGVALGHRRLAIVDLSPEGHQPMVSVSRRYIIIFNGEIYNFLQLRSELTQLHYTFRGTSDTEVMLAAFEAWGVKRSVERFNGMFAFALWDRQERVLYLVRDRLGIKPMYYGWIGHTFVFGSELKALRAHPGFRDAINRDALALFMRYNYIPAPHTIYRDVSKLHPGQILSLRTEPAGQADAIGPQHVAIETYWSAQAMAQHGIDHPFRGTEQDAIDHLDTLLRDAVKLRMIADVPLGAFLSGGIDSSTVVALMQAQSERPVKTFTIGFHEDYVNEAQYAKAIADHLGTDHTEMYVTPQQTLDVIPKLPQLYDEPFSDSSQIPTFLISELTRQYVTVSLSGDGGDELFAGYDRYFYCAQGWKQIAWLPRSVRSAIGRGLMWVPTKRWDAVLGVAKPILPGSVSRKLFGARFHLFGGLLETANREDYFIRKVAHWKTPERLIKGASELPTRRTNASEWVRTSSYVQWMQFVDLVTYLVDDLLVKVDRASMGVSLEARVPLLDHRVVEFAWGLPPAMVVHDGQSKWLLRQVLDKYVPHALVDRPKGGFEVPIKLWLRSSLRDWAENLLDEHRLREEGYFDPAPIRKKWEEHLAGDRVWSEYLWDVLMFQAWLEHQRVPVNV